MRSPNRFFLFVLGFGLLNGVAAIQPAWGAALEYEYEDGIDAVSEIRLPPDALMLKLYLDGFTFDPILIGYSRKAGVFLPLGQITQILGLAISVSPSAGKAEGFVLNEDRKFELDVRARTVLLEDRQLGFKPNQVEVMPDDIYVSAKLLSVWLPITFAVDIRSASVTAKPREPLPIQQRLQRENRNLGSSLFNIHYPSAPDDYLFLEQPYIDLTLSGEHRRDRAGRKSNKAAYTLYGASDVAYHTTTFSLFGERDEPLRDYRLTMGRKVTDATLLGPLHAEEYQFGDIVEPSISSISYTRHSRGAMLSNFPFYVANQLDRHSFRGELPPGWDVELRHNGAIIGYQPAGGNGYYDFDDIPLYSGTNRFELIFYGAQGQIRTERYTFLLNDTFFRPGQLYYRFSGGMQDDLRPGFQAESDREVRASGQVDVGLFKPLTATLQGTTFQLGERRRSFGKLGLRAYWRALLIQSNYIRGDDGGGATENSAQLGLGWVNLAGEHTRFRRFTSEVFNGGYDFIRHHSGIRLDTMPISSEYFPLSIGQGGSYELYDSGTKRYQLNNRVSLFLQRTAVSNQIQGNYVVIPRAVDSLSADGSFYVSRRIFEIGLNGTMQYSLYPVKRLDSAAFNTEWRIGAGYFVTLGVVEAFVPPSTSLSAGVAKDLGDYSAGLSGRWSEGGDWSVNLVLSVGVGRDRYQSDWFAEARPIGNTGAVAPRVFVDANQNGHFDSSERTIEGASFFVNGSSAGVTTASNGHAHLGNLSAYQPVEISLSAASLPDAAMYPTVPGASFLPRPGHTATVDFPVVIAGEVDGTLFLQSAEGLNEVANVTMELINEKGKIVKREKTAFDGYFWIPQIPPGNYSLRPAPAEIAKLGQEAPVSLRIKIGEDGTVVNGADITIGKKALSIRNLLGFRPRPPASAPPAETRPVVAAPPVRAAPVVILSVPQMQLASKIEAGGPVILAGVDFLPGTTFPKMGAMNKLQDIMKVAQARPDLKIELLVHTDMVGSKAQIQKLSIDRAKAIEKVLRGKGSRLRIVGMGNSKPIALGFSFKGKEKNNRVEAIRRP